MNNVKNIIYGIIILITISCSQKKTSDNVSAKSRLSMQQISDSISKIKKVYEVFMSYNKLENLFKSGLDRIIIPNDIIRKIVKLDGTSFNNEKAGYYGEFISHSKYYNFVQLRQGYNNVSRNLFITFNKYGQQIDFKIFVKEIWNCKSSYIGSWAHFPNYNISNDFIVSYYKAKPLDKSMPIHDKLKVIKEEKWSIDSNGFFILLPQKQ